MSNNRMRNESRGTLPPVSIEQQRAMGLRVNRYDAGNNFTPGRTAGDFSPADKDILLGSLGTTGEVMSHRQQTHHAGSTDTAMGLAQASLLYAAAYGAALAFITGGLLLAGWLTLGGDGGRWLTAWMVVWGLACLAALAVNRWQGLHFSPAGIAHHEIDSRERVAMHAIDRHADIVERRLGLADDSNVRYIEVDDE